MKAIAATDLTVSIEAPGVEIRTVDVGGMRLAFETILRGKQMTYLFKGLPNDMCQAAHWGYVFKGKVAFRSATDVQTFEAGHAYFVPPGHVAEILEDTEVLELTPLEQAEAQADVVMKNYADRNLTEKSGGSNEPLKAS